jgi:hypothetical protein
MFSYKKKIGERDKERNKKERRERRNKNRNSTISTSNGHNFDRKL